MAADLLSDALELVHLTGALVYAVDLDGTWGVTGGAPLAAFSTLLPPGTSRVIAFHIVLDGSCWVHHASRGWLELPAGHAVIVSHGDRHDLCDRPGRATTRFEDMLDGQPLSALRHLHFCNGGGASARLLCGFLGCDQRAFDPLCRALPPMFEVALGAPMRTLVGYAMANALDAGPGAAALRGRLAELLFLGALRQYMRALPPDATGWLAALRDPLVGRALQALHARPGEHWSVDRLATCIASSRSVLAARFRAVVGEPPMHYLARLRMQLAARRLEQGRNSVATIAGDVGYASGAAFQRAFKRHFGVPPAAWRRHATAPH